MKTLHFYLTRQVLATLLMTVAVFTFVLLLANALKEILVLLINRQASIGGVAEAMLYLIPWIMTFALPMGMLTAALLVFGRFSADQELTAVKASGVSLVSLISPILALSCLLCGVSALVNLEVGPRCRMAYKSLLLRMAGQLAGAALPEGRFIRVGAKRTDATGSGHGSYIVYLGQNDGHNLKDIYIYGLDANAAGKEVINQEIVAPRGELQIGTNQTTLLLFNCHIAERTGPNDWKTLTGDTGIELNSQSVATAEEKPGISDMTFRQLQKELRDTEAFLGRAEYTSLLEVPKELIVGKMAELRDRRVDPTTKIRVQIHQQLAMSFACLGFTLIGIPLGIQAHRRETNIGIAIAIGLAFIYYGLVIVGQSLSGHGEWAPYLIVWIPNFLFQVVGSVMLWRVNRGL